MLFLYRPRQTWMPYRLPREATQQAAYNRQMQQKFQATQRVRRSGLVSEPATTSDHDVISQLKQLGELHASGVLSDSEFASMKARLIRSSGNPV